MKILLKILCAPVIAVLCIFVWFCSGLLYCTAWVFGIFSALIGILGIAVLATYSPKNGIILLVIAFLVSPVGIPMESFIFFTRTVHHFPVLSAPRILV